jgi:bridging integrator 3
MASWFTRIAIKDAPYRATVLEPIGKLCSYNSEVNNAISKRNKKALDYDAARSKVKKLVDKPSDDTTKLPRVIEPGPSPPPFFSLAVPISFMD